MKSALAFIGLCLLLVIGAGYIGLIDFRLCIAPVGGCGWTVDRGTPVVDPSATLTRVPVHPVPEAI